jgi:hypothetical protein
MKPVTIRPLTKDITIHFDGQQVRLPKDMQAKVDAHWLQLVTANPHLFNGEVFTVVDFADTNDGMRVKLAVTDFAHHMYTSEFDDLGEQGTRVIHSAALVITNDNKLIFGAMSKHTSRPGQIVCSGGGLDYSDIQDGVVNIEHSTAHELREELGVDLYDTQRVKYFLLAYLKSGGRKGVMSMVYTVYLKQTSSDFMATYKQFADELVSRGEESEFDELFAVDNSNQAVEDFVELHEARLDEYMPALLRAVASERT